MPGSWMRMLVTCGVAASAVIAWAQPNHDVVSQHPVLLDLCSMTVAATLDVSAPSMAHRLDILRSEPRLRQIWTELLSYQDCGSWRQGAADKKGLPVPVTIRLEAQAVAGIDGLAAKGAHVTAELMLEGRAATCMGQWSGHFEQWAAASQLDAAVQQALTAALRRAARNVMTVMLERCTAVAPANSLPRATDVLAVHLGRWPGAARLASIATWLEQLVQQSGSCSLGRIEGDDTTLSLRTTQAAQSVALRANGRAIGSYLVQVSRVADGELWLDVVALPQVDPPPGPAAF